MGSKIITNKISSCLHIASSRLATDAADTRKFGDWTPIVSAHDHLFMLSKNSAAPAPLTGFAIEVTGDEVVDDLGAPIDDADLTIVTVKERMDLDCPTKVVAGVIEGDTGADGNQYLLEITQQEIGFEASEAGAEPPRFYRVSIESTTAAADYNVTTIADGLDWSHLPVTTEVVA